MIFAVFYQRLTFTAVTDWYAQLMSLFNCTIGNFAVVRYCNVITYADSINEGESKLKRTCMEFEQERNRGQVVIKYDVIPFEWIVHCSKFDGEHLPPYIYLHFTEGMTWPLPKNLMNIKLVDAAFFT
jgi:hypothetical protein